MAHREMRSRPVCRVCAGSGEQGLFRWRGCGLIRRKCTYCRPQDPPLARTALAPFSEASAPRGIDRPPIPATRAVDDRVRYLQEEFTSWDVSSLEDVLAAVGGDQTAAVAVLTEWTSASAFRKDGVSIDGHSARDPVSPWQDSKLLDQTSSAAHQTSKITANGLGHQVLIRELPAAPLTRGDFDRIMAARLTRQCGGSKGLSGVLKAASLWKQHTHQHQALRKLQRQDTATALADVPEHSGSRRSDESRPSLREDAILAGKALLEQRCKFLAVKSLEMEDDGNCQFRALSQELYGSQAHHFEIRMRVASELRQNALDYSVLFEEGQWEGYVESMERSQTWGDELTLRAAANAFKARIHVLTSTEANWYLIYEPASGLPDGGRQLFLTYVAPIHYNTLAPLR